jgi:aminoglycoside phosphotransferase (APT) family kinase protein
LNRDRLESYLTGRLGEPVRIADLTQAFPGLSRETWFVTLDYGGGQQAQSQPQRMQQRSLVVRADPPGGPFPPVPLEYEYKVYEHVARTAVPVPKPLWFDAAADPADGRPLFVREMVDGSTLLPGLDDPTPAAAQRRKRVAFEHAEKLALLHKVDWKSVGFGSFMDEPDSAEDAPRRELQKWWRVWEQVRTAPFPIVTEALHWFADHLPPRAASVSLCKGQNGIGEEIWRDDRIVAMCDWELANIGDPCQDFALSQGMLKLHDRDEIIAHYEQAVGFSLPADNIAYYIVWNAFKSLLALNNGLNGFLSGDYQRLARASLGYGKARLYEHLLGAVVRMDVQSAATFILSGQPNPYHSRRVAGG